MVKKLQINFGNKTFYTLIAILAVLVVSAVVIAYNTNPANPAVMGHTANEIEGGMGWRHTDVKVYDSTPTSGAWTDLDLSNYVGKRNSLVLLKVENAFGFKTRVNGEQADIGQASPSSTGAGTSAGQAGTGTIIYLAIETDNLGVIEFNSYYAENVKIWLLGYV